jgi:hypothetical protein
MKGDSNPCAPKITKGRLTVFRPSIRRYPSSFVDLQTFGLPGSDDGSDAVRRVTTSFDMPRCSLVLLPRHWIRLVLGRAVGGNYGKYGNAIIAAT